MNPTVVIFTLVAATLLGLAIGPYLAVVVYRVPAGIPLTRPGRHSGVELTTCVGFAVVAWWFVIEQPAPTVAATLTVTVGYLYLAAVSIALTLIDLRTHRLPNAIVLPAYAVALGTFTSACILGADWWALGRAVIGMAVLYGFYFILRVVRPGGMGGGDVKLAGVLGLYLGWLSWGALVVGAFAAFLFGGIFGTLLLLRKRADRRTAIPFGPWMILGAWTGVFAGEALTSLYLAAPTGL